MTIKNIRLFGDTVLTKKADEVRDFDKELQQLVKDLTKKADEVRDFDKELQQHCFS